MDNRDTQQNTATDKGQSVAPQDENAFFHKHTAVSVISKKTEKIATAIYMVTDFMPDSEPLRHELRTHAIALITGTRKIGARSAEGHYGASNEVVRTMEDTVVLVRLASTIGLISEMNARILENEIGKVKEGILRHYGNWPVAVTTHPGYANIILSESMFDVAEPEPRIQAPAPYKGHDFDKGHTAVQTPVSRPVIEQAKKPEAVSRKTDIGIKIARRNDVLNVIRSKGKVSIKDITTIMKDMSEKTVQRELLALVKEGVLSKEGEKRWSTYRIAS